MNNNRLKSFDDILRKSNKEQKEKLNYKFHQIIEKDKEFILNCYRNQPIYQDSLSQLERASKGNFAYQRMVKNGLKNKSSFIKVILQSIKKVQFKKVLPKKKKLKYGYNVPEIDIVRKKKYDIEKRNRLKAMQRKKNFMLFLEKKNYSLDSNKKVNSLLSAGKNIMDQLDTNITTNKNSRINSGSSRIFSGITKNLDNISTINRSLTRSASMNSMLSNRAINNKKKIDFTFPEKKIMRFNSILDKCKEEINHGNRLGGKFEKFTNLINENISLFKQNRENKEDINIQDQRIIEDKIKKNQKYKLLEIEKFKDLKRKIDAKISDNYVYFNRKKYAEYVKDKRKEEEFDLYLEDINKINEKLEKKKVKEKEKLHEIENLLDDVYKKKNYLKNQVSNYNYNRIIEKEYEKYMKKNFVFNDKYFMLNEKKSEEYKGNLIPRLLEKKEEISKMKKNEKQK